MHKLHLTCSATVLITLAAACGLGARNESATAQRKGDTEHVVTALSPSNEASRNPTGKDSSHAAPAVGGEPLAVCDTVASAWRSVKGAEVTRAESTFYAFVAGDTVLGCHVSMVA